MKLLAIEIPTPLHDGQTWSLQSLLLSTNLIGGQLPPSPSWAHIAPVLKVAGTILVVSLLASLAFLPGPSSRGHAAVDSRPTRVLLAAGLLHSPYQRRVAVLRSLLPGACADARAHCGGTIRDVTSPTRPYQRCPPEALPALVLLCVWAFISATGTRYVLATNGGVGGDGSRPRGEGRPARRHQRGLPMTAWRLYAHSGKSRAGDDHRRCAVGDI